MLVCGRPFNAHGAAVADGLERARAGPVVVGDLAGVHLVRKANAFGVEDVEDGIPASREVLVALVKNRFGNGRKQGDVGPDGGAGEADNGGNAKATGHLRGEAQFFGRAGAYPFGFAVTPNARAQDGVVAKVDGRVAHSLASKVVGDGEELEVVLGQDAAARVKVGGVFGCSPHVQVVAGAGELEPIVAPAGSQARDVFQGKVDPLAGEKGELWGRHGVCLKVIGTGLGCQVRGAGPRVPGCAEGRMLRFSQSLGPGAWPGVMRNADPSLRSG